MLKHESNEFMSLAFTLALGGEADIPVRLNLDLNFNRPAADFAVRHKKLAAPTGRVNSHRVRSRAIRTAEFLIAF